MYGETGDWETTMEAVRRAWEAGMAPIGFDREVFLDFRRMEPKIFYRLVNRQANSKLLGEVPWEGFLNLAKVYYARVQIGNGTGSITVYRNHLEMWGISEEELKEAAERNMSGTGVAVTFMEEVLSMLKRGALHGNMVQRARKEKPMKRLSDLVRISA